MKIELNFDNPERANEFFEWFLYSGEVHYSDEVSIKPKSIQYEKEELKINVTHGDVFVYMVYDGRANNFRNLTGEELEEKLLEISIVTATEDIEEAERVSANTSGVIIQYLVENGAPTNTQFYEERQD